MRTPAAASRSCSSSTLRTCSQSAMVRRAARGYFQHAAAGEAHPRDTATPTVSR